MSNYRYRHSIFPSVLYYVVLALMLALPTWATLTATAAPFEEGIAAYSAADYPAAIEAFTQAVEEEPTAEAYYNLASAYYKNGDLPLAILHFHRAYRINPTDSDTRFNLELTSSQIVDDMEATPTLFLGRWLEQMSQWLSLTAWRLLGLLSFAALLVGLFIYLRGESRRSRQLGFYLALSTLCLTILVNILAYRSYSFTHDEREAILLSSIVTVKSSPDASAKDIMVVHGGLKVETLQSISGCTEVKFPDGSIGWIPDHSFGLINNFKQ